MKSVPMFPEGSGDEACSGFVQEDSEIAGEFAGLSVEPGSDSPPISSPGFYCFPGFLFS